MPKTAPAGEGLEALTPGTQELMGRLDQPLHVDAYVTAGVAQTEALARALVGILEQYRAAGRGKFEFTLIDPSTPELRQRAKEAGILPLEEAGAPGKAPAAPVYAGLSFTYGKEREVVPQLTGDPGGLEFWISTKILQVHVLASGAKYRFGVVSRKQEVRLSDSNLVWVRGQPGRPSIESVIEEAFPYYEVADVDLRAGSAEIDPQLSGLIVTQPGESYSLSELRRIDQFVMLGGKALLLFVSAVSLPSPDPSLQAHLDLHGLEPLLSGYGVEMQKDAIFDFGSHFLAQAMTGEGEKILIRHPALVLASSGAGADPDRDGGLDTTGQPFFRIPELMFPFASSLQLHPERQPHGVAFRVLAQTTKLASSRTDENLDLDLRREWRPQLPVSTHTLAATVVGNLASAFAAADVPPLEPGAHSSKPSRVLVVSSSQYLANPFVYSAGEEQGPAVDRISMFAEPYARDHITNTILSFKQALDWATNDIDLTAASAKIGGSVAVRRPGSQL